MRYSGWRLSLPVALAIIGSLLLTLATWQSGASINNDGVLYLTQAHVFIERGFAAATQLYGWPFYSIAVAVLSRIGLSLLDAAQVINAASFAVLSGAFVAGVRLLYPSRLDVHYLAVPVILLLPELAELRHEVLRDNGYLASLLVSFVLFLRFVNQRSIVTLLCWGVAVLVATLFRIEAAALWLGGALALLSIRRRPISGLLLIAVGIGAAIVLFLLMKRYAPWTRVADLEVWWAFYSADMGSSFNNAAERLNQALLNQYSENYAKESTAAVLAVLLAGKVFKGLTPLHALFLWLGRTRSFGLLPAHRPAWIAYAICAALPPVLFLFQHFFLTQRYVFALIVIVLLLVPYAISISMSRIGNVRTRWLVAAVVLVLFTGATARKVIGEQDQERVAGEWLESRPGTVWTNSTKLGFYVNPEFRARTVTVDWSEEWGTRLPQAGDFIWMALVVSAEEEAAVSAELERRGLAVAQRFDSRRKSVLLWRRPGS